MMKGFFNVLLPRKEKDAVAILLYGQIGRDEKVDSAAIVAELMALTETYRNIDIRINSMGGEVYAGMAIFNALRASDANINIYVDGVAASMAAVIALCGRPLHMSRYSRLMLHQVSGGIYGTAAEIKAYAEQVESLTDVLVDVVAERSGVKPEEAKARWFDGSDHWITAQEALSMKLADSIYDMKDGTVPAEGSTAESIYEFTNRLYSQPINKDNMVILEELRKMSSFRNVTTEEQAVAEVSRLEDEAAKVSELEAEVSALRAEKAASEKAAHEAVVDLAVADGRIQQTQKTQYLALMEKDFEGVKALLESMPKGAGRVTAFLDNDARGNRCARQELEAMSWDEIDKAERLMELKNEYPELYKAKMEAKFNA